MKKLISIITPCFNEEENVRDIYAAVNTLFVQQLKDYDYEHIFCDNASTDATVSILRELAGQDARVKVIINSRNFGPFRSAFNGLMSTKGDAVLVMLAADGQDPVGLLVDFVRQWEAGYKVVYGIRRKRSEFWLMVSVRKFYYRLVKQLSDIKIPVDVGEFQLIDRVVVDALRKFDDQYPYIRGMIANCGFKSTGIAYDWQRRRKSFSKNSLYHLIDQAINGLVSSANVPLRLCIFLGFFISALSLAYGAFQLAVNIIWYRQFSMPGISTLIVTLFFFMGIQFLFLGVLGEYIGAIHSQVRKKPLVIEEERINF